MKNPFLLPDDKLKTLLASYSSWLNSDIGQKEKDYNERQKEITRGLERTLLNKKYLSRVSKKDLAQRIFDYSRNLEGPVYIRLGMPRISNNANKIKRRLLYLIESSDSPFKKATAILEGRYRIPIFAKAFWTPIFLARYPKVLPNWNNKTERFLGEVGIDLRSSKFSTEKKYQQLSEAFLYLQQIDPKQDFYTLNHLMHYGTEIPEGKDLMRELRKEKLEDKKEKSQEVFHWRIIEPLDTHDIAVWPACREKELVAIGYEDNPGATDVTRMRDEIKIGDKIIAYLEKGRIGGIGTVVGDYEDYLKGKPQIKDYFGGKFWRRRKVHWDYLPQDAEYWQLPSPYSKNIPGMRQTIFKLTENQFDKIMKMIGVKGKTLGQISKDFKGFNKETFELLTELSKDTSYETVKLLSSEIHEKAIHPLGDLLKDIACDFDTKDILGLEKEKSLSSRLFKANPRLGAWSYIWGAFYQKGESRVTSMQFFVWMNKDHLTYGVYPATNQPSVKRRAIKNLGKYGEQLKEYLPGDFYKDFLFYTDCIEGKPRSFFQVKDHWDLIRLYEKYNLNIGKVLKPREVIDKGQGLVDLIRDDFEKLIPLYVFGISDNPLDFLSSYYQKDVIEAGKEEELVTEEAILGEIFLKEEKFSQIIDLLENSKKKQVILQGPPGTGKTFIAGKIARYLTQSEERIETIQFHPSYSYEDFIEGYRPSENRGFELTAGIFKSFCHQAKSNPDKSYVLVIDEINRGNLSKIFGELLYLLEYRDQVAKLTYSQELFSIPQNLYIIGTMNTADRSLAIMDYALRRRFYFVSLSCQTRRLGGWLKEHGCRMRVGGLIEKIKRMNKRISEEMRSSDFVIGHSYFMKEDLDREKLKEVIEFEIKPLLEEYFFDKKESVAEILGLIKVEKNEK